MNETKKNPVKQCGMAQLLNIPAPTPKVYNGQINPDFENNELQRKTIVDQYIPENEPQSAFSNADIQKYQDQFLSTEDHLNNSSRNFVSSVDKLNEYFTVGGNELNELKGETIADIYDNLQKKEVDKFKSCKNPNCILPSDYDDTLQRNIYKNNDGVILTNYDTMYEFDVDNVNNGGMFDNFVMGNDSMSMMAPIAAK
jgi:hypothetical protein